MKQRTLSPFFASLLASGAFALSGCSLALDTQKPQCSKPSDCARVSVGGSATQLCVAGFCEPVTCENTDECRERDGTAFKASYCGPTPGMGTTLVCQPAECSADKECDNDEEVCKLDSSQCVRLNNATCLADADCANYDKIANNICEDGRCESPECTKDDQCSGVSDSATCVMGRCDDVTWGCIGQPDDREVPMSGTSTLKVRILSLLKGNGPLAPTDNLVVKVCSVGGADPNCDNPLPSAQYVYDEATGMATISGLQQKQKFWLSITANNLASVDWYTQRVPVGETEEPEPIVLVPSGIEKTLGNQFDPPIAVDLENTAALIIRIYNCNAENGEGVSVSATKTLGADTKIFYLDANYSILLDEQETDSTGTAGMVNVQAVQNRVNVTRAGQPVTQFDLPLRSKVLTYLALYPRDYN